MTSHAVRNLLPKIVSVRKYACLGSIQATTRKIIINTFYQTGVTRSPGASRRLLCTVSDDAAAVNDDQKTRTVNPEKDRRQPIPLETALKYMQSQAYKETYGPSDPVWKQYRRNFKGAIPPKKTRQKCTRNGVIITGNPCPICRDKYLVVNYQNVKLLKQFISPITGEIYKAFVTGVCQVKHMELLVAIEKAKDYGYLTYEVPFRQYNYSEYYDPKSIK